MSHKLFSRESKELLPGGTFLEASSYALSVQAYDVLLDACEHAFGHRVLDDLPCLSQAPMIRANGILG